MEIGGSSSPTVDKPHLVATWKSSGKKSKGRLWRGMKLVLEKVILECAHWITEVIFLKRMLCQGIHPLINHRMVL